MPDGTWTVSDVSALMSMTFRFLCPLPSIGLADSKCSEKPVHVLNTIYDQYHLPSIVQENKYSGIFIGIFSYFSMKMYIVCTD